MGNVPPCVGVPSRTPVAVWNVRPVGNVPDSPNVVVPMPPVCVNVTLKAVPAGPDVVTGLVTVMVWQAMTRVYVAPLPVQPLPSVTVTTIGNEPVCVGVPERTPAVDKLSPAGSIDAVVNVVVPIVFEAVKLWLKALLAT